MISLQLERVSVAYDGHDVVRELALTVAAGEWLALIGPNGAGKTTVLRAVAGLIAHRGRIDIGGDAVARMATKAVARRVALVHQEPFMPAGMTVSHYVILGRTPHLGYFAGESMLDRRVVAGVLERLSLSHLADRTLDHLSGGERQRVAIARALAQQAPVLLLDEPTQSLDIGAQQEVLELIDMMRRADGLTVLAAMHDLTLAAQYADRVALLAAGCVAIAGTPADVLTERTIAEHYGARVEVIRHDGQRLAVVPVRPGRNGSAEKAD